MSPLVVAASVAGVLLLLALRTRRPALTGVAGGLLGGPLFYLWLGGRLARVRGEGHFYSFPFGGFHLGDAEILLSAATWILVAGLLAYACARRLRPRTP
jgi:hypothetical protein